MWLTIFDMHQNQTIYKNNSAGVKEVTVLAETPTTNQQTAKLKTPGEFLNVQPGQNKISTFGLASDEELKIELDPNDSTRISFMFNQ